MKNGSPRLQLNRAPLCGGSVATTLSATHVLTSLALYCDTKSRGSTGNVLPPIWKARLCGTLQGKIGSALEFLANADETLLKMELTTSSGPRIMLFPCKENQRGNNHKCKRGIITVSRRAERVELDPVSLVAGNCRPSSMTPSRGTSQRLPTVLTFQRTCELSRAIFDSQRINLERLISVFHIYWENETNLARSKGGGAQTSVPWAVEAHWHPRKR